MAVGSDYWLWILRRLRAWIVMANAVIASRAAPAMR